MVPQHAVEPQTLAKSYERICDYYTANLLLKYFFTYT